MQWTLGIDTSSTAIYLGLIAEDGQQLTASKMVVNAHAEHILPLVKELLEEAQITAQDITLAGVVVGPGSFTGLRIGLSFIKGLFITETTETIGLSSFEVVATAAPQEGTIGVALDARQDNIFWASFTKDTGEITSLEAPTIISKELFYNTKVATVDALYFDTMGFTNSTVFDKLGELDTTYSIQDTPLERGLAAAQYALAHKDISPQTFAVDLEPNYMQVSYAERSQGRK